MHDPTWPEVRTNLSPRVCVAVVPHGNGEWRGRSGGARRGRRERGSERRGRGGVRRVRGGERRMRGSEPRVRDGAGRPPE
eukprot:6084923-Prymnesium_polylepis.1